MTSIDKGREQMGGFSTPDHEKLWPLRMINIQFSCSQKIYLICQGLTSFGSIIPELVTPREVKERLEADLLCLRRQFNACLMRLLHEESDVGRLILVLHLYNYGQIIDIICVKDIVG